MLLFMFTDTYLLVVTHGKTMRRLRNIEQLRQGIHTEAIASILMARLDRRAAATSKSQAGATILDPMDSELPVNIVTQIESLSAKEVALVEALPDYMKKLING